MRLKLFAAATLIGAGLVACKSDPPEDTDTPDPCVESPGSAACCADQPNHASCEPDDTAPTGGGGGPIGYYTFFGAATVTPGASYAGTETLGIYYFNDQSGTDTTNTTALCEVEYQAASATPDATCTDCDWAFSAIAMSNGALVAGAAPVTTPDGSWSCTDFVSDTTPAGLADGGSFRYGYWGAYPYGGMTYEVMMYTSADADTWGPVTDATFDGTNFAYDWIQNAIYLP
ncbi:MAG: hypothetical protein H6737_26085 [Alphaproteobacteria bacterium]|nr:hypothetical protein [Alphaproteobacteria bacterium]